MIDLARVHSRLLAAFFALTTIVICGCGVPVAPGYQIQKESLAVHFISGNPPHLAIRADYSLANIGNSPLHRIPLILPGEKDFGLANLGAQIDGKDVAPQHNPHEAAEDWRIPLASPWQRKQKINLTLSYDLAASTPVDPRILVGAHTFYLNDSGWFPAFMGFKAFLSPAVTRPNSIDVSVTVPSDFRATASGRFRGAKKQNAEMEYLFRIGKSDFNPYVLAGQYNEQRVSTDGVTVAIWTLKPIPSEQAQKTATQIATVVKSVSHNFGALPKSMAAIFDIDLSKVGDRIANGDPLQGSLVPGTVDSGSEDILAQMDLAHTWFGHLIVPRPEAWTLDKGFEFYAAILSSPGDNQVTNSVVRSALSVYDDDKRKAVEKPIALLTPSDPQDQLDLGSTKMELFFFALEDKCGQQNVTHAIAHMVYALRGQEYGYPEFRSALEEQCHQDLAEFFSTWLAKPGIPPDFRARYERGGANGNQP